MSTTPGRLKQCERCGLASAALGPFTVSDTNQFRARASVTFKLLCPMCKTSIILARNQKSISQQQATNRELFCMVLGGEFAKAVREAPEMYACKFDLKEARTPEEYQKVIVRFVEKYVEKIEQGYDFEAGGPSVQSTCELLGLPATRQAIHDFIGEPTR